MESANLNAHPQFCGGGHNEKAWHCSSEKVPDSQSNELCLKASRWCRSRHIYSIRVACVKNSKNIVYPT